MKTEIRFVEKDGEWWAVAADVATALEYTLTAHKVRMINSQNKGVHKVDTLGGAQDLLIISEFGIYEVVFNSHKTEAKEFKRWVFSDRQELLDDTVELMGVKDKYHLDLSVSDRIYSLAVGSQHSVS